MRQLEIKIGLQCELVWDFSQIKVDALWINQKNCSFTMNICTFCSVEVMNPKLKTKKRLQEKMFGLVL